MKAGNKELNELDSLNGFLKENSAIFRNRHIYEEIFGDEKQIAELKKLDELLDTSSDAISHDYFDKTGLKILSHLKALQKDRIYSYLSNIYSNVDLESLLKQAKKDVGLEGANDQNINKVVNSYEDDSGNKVNKEEIVEWMKILISFICTILSSNSLNINVNYYNRQNVKYTNNYYNYYFVEHNIDIKSIIDMKYVIVNRDTVVRKKHDCNSSVVGYLYAGDVVSIMEQRIDRRDRVIKYKKWRKVKWVDENGKDKEGWIQNYKITVFKNKIIK